MANGEVRQTLAALKDFINTCGFPVLAFCLMFWYSHMSLSKVTDALNSNTQALTHFSETAETFYDGVQSDHEQHNQALALLLKAIK